jgi:hypothetical protein
LVEIWYKVEERFRAIRHALDFDEMMQMGASRRVVLLALVIAAAMGSAVASGFTISPAMGAASQGTTTYDGTNFGNPWLPPDSAGNVTIDSAQAEATVEAAIPSFTIGTPTLHGTNWQVPIQNGADEVTSIQVTTISTSTVEEAKNIVEVSFENGWKAGEPALMRAMYSVPVLDSNGATIGYVMVDGNSGEIVNRPSTPRTTATESITLTVTSEQAKTKVSNAIKALKVDGANDSGTAWIVSIKYNDLVVMTVLLGKVNTPTSADAVKAVQDSMGKGWSAGEPRQIGSSYSVPIVDANGNTIGNIRVDGQTGEITPGFGNPGDRTPGFQPPHT